MQNFFLSPALGRDPNGPGHKACDQLITHAIPAARKAGVRVVWVNWGLTDEEVRDMPPGVKRAFGFYSIPHDAEHDVDGVVAGGEVEGGVGVDKHGKTREGRSAYKGIGTSMGQIKLGGGQEVEGGRLLMRDSWNAALYPPLEKLFEEGRELEHKPDIWVHKNRMSGLWGDTTPLQEFLEKEGITTLLFAGVNTDQCVGGTLTDAFSRGYDCVLLSDGCGTSSPGYAQECWEYNAAHTFGFCCTCGQLAEGVDGIEA
jgi:nicotinamidase-related amidase